MEVVSRVLRRSLLHHGSEILACARFSSEPPKDSKLKPCPADETEKERLPRTGDFGTAITLAGEVRPKDDPVFHAIGTTNELCSVIGVVRMFAQDKDHEYVEYLNRIQTILIDISVAISNCTHTLPYTSCSLPTVTTSPSPFSSKGPCFSKRHVTELEGWIDEYQSTLPPVEHFVVPGGGQVSAMLHMALSVCRRAERTVVPLVRDGNLDKETQIYLNRLAEFLFTISRVAARTDKSSEAVYSPKLSG